MGHYSFHVTKSRRTRAVTNGNDLRKFADKSRHELTESVSNDSSDRSKEEEKRDDSEQRRNYRRMIGRVARAMGALKLLVVFVN